MAVADDHERQRRRGHQRERGRDREQSVPAVDDPTYREVCGTCHFALQPGLLPSRSWQRLLACSQDHFGQPLDLEAGQLAQIETYLTANAAERTPGELARDIVESIGSSVPVRVTDVPEIQRQHRRLDPTVFERPSVAGRADCPACHHDAAAGLYDDDAVTVPGG